MKNPPQWESVCLPTPPYIFTSLLSLNAHICREKIFFFYAQEIEKKKEEQPKKLFLFSILFDEHHRSRIGILSTNKIISNGKYNRGTVNQDVPVHRR